MNLGVAILLITFLGYLSNWLNWHFLNYSIVRWLYYIGAFVHETSHAMLCTATGAKIVEYKVFTSQPRVVHEKSKLPLTGEPLISLAPIAGGLFFLFLINYYLLSGYFTIPHFFVVNWQQILLQTITFLKQIHLLQWQSWVMILLFFNVGAMIGPSPKDLQNIWPLLIVLFFVNSTPIVSIASVAILFIVINIVMQIILVALIGTIKLFAHAS